MASASAPGGRTEGGKKSLNVEFNLVPFIDMLSCLICFLLMAAVWVQLGKLSVALAGQDPAPGPIPTIVEPLNLVVAITPQGFLVSGNGRTLPDGDILKKGGAYDFERLGKALRDIHGQFPDQTALVVMSEDGIEYQYLIGTLDVSLANGFPNVSVSGSM